MKRSVWNVGNNKKKGYCRPNAVPLRLRRNHNYYTEWASPCSSIERPCLVPLKDRIDLGIYMKVCDFEEKARKL